MHFYRALFVGHIVEQAYNRATGLQPADGTVFADQNWGQVSAVAVGKMVGASVVDSQEKRRVFFGRSAFVELVIKQAEQSSGRNLDALGPGAMIGLEPAMAPTATGSRIWEDFPRCRREPRSGWSPSTARPKFLCR